MYLPYSAQDYYFALQEMCLLFSSNSSCTSNSENINNSSNCSGSSKKSGDSYQPSAQLNLLESSARNDNFQPPSFRSTAFIPSLFPIHRLPLPQMLISNEEHCPSVSSIAIPPSLLNLEVPLQDEHYPSELDGVSSSPISSTPESFMMPRMIKFATPTINGVRTPLNSPLKLDALPESTTPKKSSVIMTLSPDGRISSIKHNCPSD